MNNENVLNLLNSSTDDLYGQLGISLAQGSLGVKHQKPGENIKVGKRWFQFRQSELASLICSHPEIKNMVGDDKTDRRVQLVTAIIDLIIGVCGGVPVVVVATLLVKEGIDELCKRYMYDPE